MTLGASFCTSSFWGARRETPERLSRRWLATVNVLQPLHPSLSSWFKGVDGRGVPLMLTNESIEADIAAAATDDGFVFNTKSDISGRGSRLFELDMSAGSNWMNIVVFGTDMRFVPDPEIVTYDIFRGGLLAVAENFDAERAYAYPVKLLDLWPRPPNPYPPFPIAWISYCAPRIAHLVTPPSTAIVEHRPDGGLLMAATDETFDVGNPAHMEVARDIEAAVAPLHCTRPWEPEGRRGPAQSVSSRD